MNHKEARFIVDQAWLAVQGRPATDNEASLTQAIAWLESHYGRAAGQHEKWAAEGKYVWGNLERSTNADGTCPAGTTLGQDWGATKNARCFYYHSSDLESAKALIHNLTKVGTFTPAATLSASEQKRQRDFAQRSANILAAMATGSATELAKAMKAEGTYVGFFEAPVDQYAKLIAASLTAIRKDVAPTPSPPIPSPPSPEPIASSSMPPASVEWSLGLIVALGGLAWWTSR